MDDQEDDDTCPFLEVCELFDLTQYVSHSIHKYGNTLDLIIIIGKTGWHSGQQQQTGLLLNHIAVKY